MKRQLAHATATPAKRRVKKNRVFIVAESLMEQRRTRKHARKTLKPYSSDGEACIAAERLSAQKAHLDAAKIWIAVGLRNKAAQEVRDSGWDLQIAQFCLRHGMKWEIRELMEELAKGDDALRASNFAYAIGEGARAIDLGLVHLATESSSMPDVFRENKELMMDIARKMEEGENYGTAGRIYERMGEAIKAARCYARGGHLDELERMEKEDGETLRGDGRASLNVYIEACTQATQIRQDEAGWKTKAKDALARYDSRHLRASWISFSGTASGVLGAGGAALLVFNQLLAGVVLLIGAGVMLSTILVPLIIRENAGEKISRAGEKRGAKSKPLPLPPHPIVFSEGEEAKLMKSPESQASKLVKEGKIYEAGLMYAKMGNVILARDCGNQLAKGGKMGQARELWMLVYGTTYLYFEEMEKTEPEAAKAAFISIGIDRD
ncbi:MAG: hypothetical protein PHQ80_03315 [Candidatus ainarchaeum sp.]|nr:hypothetical protein [Candidatus ainarchaeum sp.]